ncbi:MAG: hypothetical protein E7534_04515 [Ruminococcaceae bacterium]|nr:hypothetical protein [Oscillospiraceae bacterium]
MMERQAPFIRGDDRITHHNRDLLIALLPILVMPTLFYGWRPVLLVLTGMLTAMVCECVGCVLMRRRISVLDGYAAASGALIGAMMSPLAPMWMPVVGAIFAILVVKFPFGGQGHYLFSPAAAAVALLTQCWPHHMFTYPVLHTKLPLLWEVPAESVITATSPAGQLATGTYSVYSGVDLLTGMIPGPIAGTGLLVLAAVALYLFIRHSTFPMVTGPYILTCAVLAVLFPRASGDWYISIINELSAGYLLFAGLFLLNSCITPRSRTGRAVYGVLAGCLVMLLRHVGQFEEGTCFAVLLVNVVAPRLDNVCWRVRAFARRLWERKGVHAE